MAEEAPAPAAPPAKVPRKKSTTSRKKTDKLSVPTLICTCLSQCKERKGMSGLAIKKYLASQGCDVVKANRRINTWLRRMVAKGTLTQTRGVGASGSFRLAKTETTKKKKKSEASKVVKKSPGKVKRSAAGKKTAARKPAKKSPKKGSKKSSAKSPAKKTTATKKTTPKKIQKKKPTKRTPAKKVPKKAAPKKVKVTGKGAAKKTTTKRTKK